MFFLGIIGYVFNQYFENKIIFGSEISGASKVNRIIKKIDLSEIPIFGSSRAEGTFIPDILGDHYFNYGISGTQDDVILFFLKKELEKKKNTPIVINFDLDGLNSAISDIAYYIPNCSDPKVAELIGREKKPWFSVPFIKYYGKYELYTKYWLTDRIALTKHVNKGSQIEKNILSRKKFQELVDQRLKESGTFKNDAIIERSFDQLFRENPNRQFIFVLVPYHSSYFSRYVNYGEADSYLNKIDALNNVKVFNFSKLPLPDSLFFNTSHLNYSGAVFFCNIFRDSLNTYLKSNKN